ncbi:hypothetical protein GGI04_003016 [Coemansia thaxteri]|uniref:Uncharacterized protein n=1 Tax=Coemansia thaxteri TaxID=2663907 RepID=A0A9W8BIB0_9FUNG|nr:hypothetical protein H4R26_003274 [Coemansia thaxteri]KAJ2003305.1 hypothetical protein GGI04_003016 [Coemansia thaxteri]KAJ2471204.1 hypothetical protein GGI02_002429 [Coemansia sp. RSA 2322]
MSKAKPTPNYAIAFKLAGGRDITNEVIYVVGEARIPLWFSRNIKRELLKANIIKNENATFTLKWTTPNDKPNKPTGSLVLGPLHNIDSRLQINRDSVVFRSGVVVVIQDDNGQVDNATTSSSKAISDEEAGSDSDGSDSDGSDSDGSDASKD